MVKVTPRPKRGADSQPALGDAEYLKNSRAKFWPSLFSDRSGPRSIIAGSRVDVTSTALFLAGANESNTTYVGFLSAKPQLASL